MTVVTAEVSGEIVIKISELPEMALAQIKAALTVRNEERDKQLAERVFGAWDLPEFIALWREETRRSGDHVICLPRGFAAGLVAGMAAMGVELRWDDRRASAPAAPGYFVPFELRDYQMAAVVDMLRAEQGFLEVPAGGGKGHPLDTDVPTPSGFRLWGDLEVGDEVLGSDGRPTKVTAVFDRGVLPTYSVRFSDHSEVLCDVDHLWYVADRTRRRTRAEWCVRSTSELMEAGLESDEGWRWKIPVARADYDRIHLPLDSYLVGALIANGHLGRGGTTLTTPDPAVIDRINHSSGPGQVHKIQDTTDVCDRYSISGIVGLTAQLGMRVHSPKKRIPSDYLRSFTPDRMELLRGLMDGDGSCREGRNSASYHTTSFGLAGDVVELANSLGATATIMTKDRRDEGKPIEYKVCINPAIDLRLFGTDRKTTTTKPGQTKPPIRSIVSIERVFDQPIRCITVAAEDSLYMIGRSYTITHNTVTMLGLFAHAQQRAVVVLDKANLLEQWRSRASTFLGLSLDLDDPRSVGKIGEDVWEERDLTIALRQTLWSRLWQIDALDWFKHYGVVVFDEGHHLSADTLGEICRRVSSRIMLGTSATPAKSEARGQIVHALVGPIVHKTTRQELYDRGVLMRPTVEQIRTDFEAEFWPTHEVDDQTPCEVPDCTKSLVKRHMHRNNYSSVLKRLVEDKERNALVARRVVSERGHVHLVASRQLKHLDLLRKAIEAAGWDGPIYMLRGEENARGESQLIAEAVSAGGQWDFLDVENGGQSWEQITPVGEHGREAVILSTIADEGLDVPPIDRTHIVFPMRQEAAVIQLIGRGERVTEGKDDSVIVDYNDPGCGAFAEQALERERVFRSTGFTVRMVVDAI